MVLSLRMQGFKSLKIKRFRRHPDAVETLCLAF
jgi:hypothetical protein